MLTTIVELFRLYDSSYLNNGQSSLKSASFLSQQIPALT
jgi:hypothetical protein